MNCTICNENINAPTSDMKMRTSFSCPNCRAQYLYYFTNNKLQLGAVQQRFSGWNLCYNYKNNITRYVKMERRSKEDEKIPRQRQEYVFDGLILKEKFLGLLAFI